MRDNPHITDFLKAFNGISGRYDPNTLFRDWCECFALAIANGCTLHDSPLWTKRENTYLDIIKKYDVQAQKAFPEMCAHLTLAFELDPFDDYLGRIYMELFGGGIKKKKLGQCFTPMDVCRACAEMTVEPKDGEVMTIADECVGGAAMLIAACEVYHKRGIDYQRWLKITAGDLDALCVHMTYIQLSLIGARADVYHRDAITRKCFDVFTTPMEILWPLKLGSSPDVATQPDTPKAAPVFAKNHKHVQETHEAKQLTLGL